MRLSNPSHVALLKIARDATWLLNQQGLAPGLESLGYSSKTLSRAFKEHSRTSCTNNCSCDRKRYRPIANIQKHLDKLPLTAQVLVEVVETREQFAVRRVEYAAACFRQENVCPQQWQLVRRAGLRPDIEAVQQVKEAIAAALES